MPNPAIAAISASFALKPGTRPLGSRGHTQKDPYLEYITPVRVRHSLQSQKSSSVATYFTQLPEVCVEALDCVDLTEARSLLNWTLDGITSASDNRRGEAKSAARTLTKQPLRTDSVGTFSFFGENREVYDQVNQKCPKRLRGILLEDFYRGVKPAKATVTTVTKKQILDGRAIFLYQAKVKTINQDTSQYQEEDVICLGSFLSISGLLKFKKARDFINQLLADLYHSPLKRLDPATHAKLILEKTGPFTNYWEGSTNILDFSKIDKLPDLYDLVADTFENKSYLSNQQLRVLDSKRFVISSIVGKEKEKASALIDSTLAQKANLADVISKINLDISTHEEKILQLATILKLLDERIESVQANSSHLESYLIPQLTIARSDENDTMAELDTSLQIFQDEYEVAKEAFSTEYNQFLAQEGKTNYHDTMLNNNVIIKDIHFRNIETGSVLSVKANPAITNDSNWIMCTLLMITTKPSCIRVDQIEKGLDAVQIAGGPYDIRLTLGNNDTPMMALRLTGHNSIFGKTRCGDEWRVKPHPHTDITIVRPDVKSLTSFIKQWSNCCLGSTEGTIKQGMQQANPKIIIAAVLSWLNSANSEDEWGQHWGWFPYVSDVNMNGRDEDAIKVTPDNTIKNALDLIQQKLAVKQTALPPLLPQAGSEQ